ncbi:hypothetical protein Taro_049494 [Colocasia esculenta]|uniref:Myb/SANT-like domain-containing protein n=1 Tax=Colocasia esculenta TaxID=4460 RepID=A0A843XB50_COLES|nr:hypothetical protein [Colocasia esculenta]
MLENSVPMSTGKGRSPNWMLRQDRILLDLLIDVYHKSYGSQGTFKAHVFQDILHQFNSTANVMKDRDSLKYRWRNIKKIYHIYEQLRTRSGWGWDDERNLPVAPDEESIQAAIALVCCAFSSSATERCPGRARREASPRRPAAKASTPHLPPLR